MGGYYCLDLYNLTPKLETLKRQHWLTDTNSSAAGADADGLRREDSSPIVSANKVILLFYLSHFVSRTADGKTRNESALRDDSATLYLPSICAASRDVCKIRWIYKILCKGFRQA